MREFKFFSSFHLGDQIFLLWFLNTAAKRFPYSHFSLWVPEQYFEEVRRLARPSGNLSVVTGPRGDHNFDGWMGTDGYYFNHRGDGSKFLEFVIGFHAYIAKKYSIEPWPTTEKIEMLLPWDCMDPEHPLKDQSFDVLVVNSQPLSGECHGFDQGTLDRIAVELSQRMKVVTTHPCGNDSIQNTIGLGLKLCHIGELASRCRFVVGVANAPFLVTFNEKSFDKIEKWYNYSIDRVNFDDDRVIWSNHINDLYNQTKTIQ